MLGLQRSRGLLVAVVALAVTLASAACSAPVDTGGVDLERAPAAAAPAPGTVELPPRTLVGANYYSWYPGNWGAGTLRAQLAPPQQPELGLYSSTDPAVAQQHIAWASEYGIDFFTLDWWPVAHQENQAGIAAFLQAPNIGDIRFSIFYETWDLSFDPARGSADMDAPGVRQAFVEDMAEIADTMFDHPSYLRIQGRPVVVLYLTRVLTGDVAGAMADVRAMWRERGYDPFVVADEVFWNVTVSGAKDRFTTVPQADRIRLFDAITAYNPYESATASHAGHAATSSFVPDVNALYGRYRDATGGEVPIIPGVIPGYNDRGVRPKLDHYVIPRAWAPGDPDGTLLAEMLDQVADRWRDPRVPAVMVTSWNEWNEDTGIEPLAAAPPTVSDSATDGISRTGGVAYAGSGTLYLEVLRDHYVAFAGQVLGADGKPRRGEVVTAWRGGKVLAQDVTDGQGRYTLHRDQMGTQPVHVVAVGTEVRADVDPARTVEVDFSAGG